MFVDKAGLQCCGQVLGRASFSAQHQCALMGITASFSRPLQGWAIRALHRFSQKQNGDMLSSWLKSIGWSACQSAQEPACAVVTTNHSLCVSMWISWDLEVFSPMYSNCARNPTRYAVMWKYYATRKAQHPLFCSSWEAFPKHLAAVLVQPCPQPWLYEFYISSGCNNLSWPLWICLMILFVPVWRIVWICW